MPRDLLSGIEKRQPRDLLADISPIKQQMPQQEEPANGFMHYASMLSGPNPMSIIRLLRSAAQGGVEAGRSIANLPHTFGMTEHKAPEGYNIGPENPNLLEEGVRVIAPSAALATATGGGSLLGMMRGGAIAGGLLDEEDPLFGAAVGAGAGAIGKAIPSLSNMFKNMRPQKVANEFANKYGAKGLEEIEAPSKVMWEKALSPKENIYEIINPNSRLTTPAHAKYVEKIGNESDYAHLRDLFAENPNLKNTHQLQSAIGEEIGGLLKKKAIEKSLPQADRVRLHELKGIRDDLKLDINNYLEKVNPELKNIYNEASKLHKDVVIPARNAARLQGKIPRNVDDTINKEDLVSALKRASTPEKLGTAEKVGYKPLPEDVLTLRKQLEINLANKKRLFNPYTIGSTAVAAGVPYSGYHLLKNLIHSK